MNRKSYIFHFKHVAAICTCSGTVNKYDVELARDWVLIEAASIVAGTGAVEIEAAPYCPERTVEIGYTIETHVAFIVTMDEAPLIRYRRESFAAAALGGFHGVWISEVENG